jgi:hypothetical protein
MMLRAFKRRALLAPAMVVAISIATAAMNSSVALASSGGAPVWGTATAFPDTPLTAAYFTSATCPSVGTCLAAGQGLASSSAAIPLVAAESGLTLTPTGASKPAITRTVTFKSAAKKRR